MSHFDETNDTIIRRRRQPSQPMGAPGSSQRLARAIAAVNVDTSQAEEARVAEADGDMLPVLYRPSDRRPAGEAQPNLDHLEAAAELNDQPSTPAPVAEPVVQEPVAHDPVAADEPDVGHTQLGDDYPEGVPADGVLEFPPDPDADLDGEPDEADVSDLAPASIDGQDTPATEVAEAAPIEPSMFALAVKATLTGDEAHTFLSAQTDGSKELDGFLAPLAALNEDEEVLISATIRNDPDFASHLDARIRSIEAGKGDPGPKGESRGKRGRRGSKRLISWARKLRAGTSDPGDFKLSKEQLAWITDAEEKNAAGLEHFAVDVHIAAFKSTEDLQRLQHILRSVQTKFGMFKNERQKLTWTSCDPRWVTGGVLPFQREDAMTLSSAELASMFRVPDDQNTPENVKMGRASQIALAPDFYEAIEEPYSPLNPPKGLLPYGIINQDTEAETYIGWSAAAGDTHSITFGVTGTGKSEHTVWEVFGAAKNGEPIVAICPHDDLAKDLLRSLSRYCPERRDDILYLDLSDEEFSPSLNPLDVHSPAEVSHAVNRVMSIMGSHFGLTPEAAPRAAKIAPLVLRALAEANLALPKGNKATLLQVSEFLEDFEFQQLVMEFLGKGSYNVKKVFDNDHGTWWNSQSDKDREAAAAPIMRYFDAPGQDEVFGKVLAGPEDKLDYTSLIKANTILIVSIGRGGKQSEVGEFIAGMILPSLFAGISSFGRFKDEITGEEIPGGVRLIVDEAPVLLKDSGVLAAALAEWRKFDGKVSMKAQSPDQFEPSVRSAVFNNIRSQLFLNVENATGLAKTISTSRTKITDTDISSLANFEGFARLMMVRPDGQRQRTEPFSMGTPMPLQMMEERLQGRPFTADEKARRDEEFKIARAEIMERSYQRLYNPAPEMKRRLHSSDRAGIPRRQMTQDIMDALTEILAKRIPEQQEAKHGLRPGPQHTWVGEDLLSEDDAEGVGWDQEEDNQS